MNVILVGILPVLIFSGGLAVDQDQATVFLPEGALLWVIVHSVIHLGLSYPPALGVSAVVSLGIVAIRRQIPCQSGGL